MNKKIYLVNRDFQLRYTKGAVLVGLASTVLTCLLLLYPLYYFEIIRVAAFVPVPFLIGMGLAALVNIGFIAAMGIILTHRIAGPMFSLVRQMRVLQAGRFNVSMQVRKDDEMKYVVRNFNELAANLMKATKNDIADLDEAIEKLQVAVKGSSDAGEIQDALLSLTSIRTKFNERLQSGGI